MDIRKYIVLGVFTLLGVTAWAQNTLNAPTTLESKAGNSISVPISMENSEDVVAVQFDVQLPFSMTSGQKPTLNESRSKGHTVSTRYLGSNKFTVLITNLENKALAGTAGTLVNIPMTISTDAQVDVDYPITLSNVVLTNRRGDNIASGSSNGIFRLQRSNSPDLEVTDVSITQSAVNPGEVIEVKWKVSNVGTANTNSGWRETISLVSASGSSVNLGTVYFSETLVKNGSTLRSASFTLSNSIGLEGEVSARVSLVTNSSTGEYVADQANNTSTGGSSTIGKLLSLSCSVESIEEGKATRFTLTRSGNRAIDESFTISNTLPQQISAPAMVTISANRSSVSFDVTAVENNEPNEFLDATIAVEASNGYTAVSKDIHIIDNDLLPISLSLDRSLEEKYNEGEIAHLTITVPKRIGTGDLTFNLGVNLPKRFKLPRTVVMPAGQKSMTVDIPIIDDNIPDVEALVELSVSAEQYQSQKKYLVLADNDVSPIEMSITPNTISEKAGANAIYATITRKEATNSKITVKISDTSDGELYYTNTITLDGGVTDATFPISIKDNKTVDGERTVKLYAEVYITSCNCTAIGNKQTQVEQDITILDDDGPTLFVSTNKSTILEGDDEGAVITVSRNTTNNAQPLVVQLSTEAADVSLAGTLTIPAGSSSATTTFKALSNQTEEGNRAITIKASANDFTPGTAWLLISDQSFPDLSLKNMETVSPSYAAGSPVKVNLLIENIGANTMPRGSLIKLMVDGEVVTSLTMDTDLPKGESQTIVMQIEEGIVVPGIHTLSAQLNANNFHTELQTVNNAGTTTVKIESNYEYTIVANKDKFKQGEAVILTGTVHQKGDGIAASTDVEVYVVYANKRTPFIVKTDEEGQFIYTYDLDVGLTGDFSYGICMPKEELTTAYGTFSVYGFTRASNDYLTNKLYVDEPFAGVFTIKNMGSQALHNIKASVKDPSGRYTVESTPIATLAGNSTAEFHYTMTPNSQSNGNAWELITFQLESDEGASLDVVTYNYAYTHTPSLVFSTNSINTTVTKGTTRNYPIHVTNTGLGESGRITVLLPSGLSQFISLITPAEIPSLQTGDSATIMLRFSAGDFDVNLIQKGSIAINCEKGNGKAIPFNVKVVSEEKGNLLVRAQDEYTIYGDINGNRPYLAGANVKLTDYNTGAIICNTITNEDGEITIENIDEGYYHLTVSADKHSTYNQNVLVNPGETTEYLATLSFQAVSYTWDVEETTVEDEYEITTSVTYETYVPRPVLVMTAPDTLDVDAITADKNALIYVILRNKGFITATDVSLELPYHPQLTFTPLVNCEGFELASNQSVTIPVLVTRNPEETGGDARLRRAPSEGANCNGKFGAPYKWPCGEGSAFSWLEKPIRYLTNIGCSDKVSGPPTSPFDIDMGHGGPGGPGGPGGGVAIGPGGEAAAAAIIKLLCMLCDCFCPDPIPPCTYTDESCTENLAKEGVKKAASAAGGKVGECLAGAAMDKAKARKANKVVPALLLQSGIKSTLFYTYHNTRNQYLAERMNAPQLIYEHLDVRSPVVLALSKVDKKLDDMHNDGTLYNADLNQLKTELINMLPGHQPVWVDFDMNNYVERIINSYKMDDGMEVEGSNYMSKAVLKDIEDRRDSCSVELFKMGFVDWNELIQSAHKDWVEYQESASKNTCAQVKLEISQKLVLTRQAFRGTLTIENGTDKTLTRISTDIFASDSNGKVATSHEMQINIESITGFEGELNGEWSLPAGAKGVATFLFIPTKYAAPDTLTTYHFGGTLYYQDDEEYRTQTLYPVALQVKPSPELDLTYFMQRDIYGDNPLTPDVIEPIIPAEFSVLIHNKGKGDADNVRMITEQPKIVENEKGLAVDFAIVSSSLNGGEKAMALDKSIATQFGDILAGTCSYATWDLTSSLLGHFVDYDVSYTHLTSYGNPDLSLLDQVTIHELIHSATVDIAGKPYRAWITNDQEDSHDEPDHIYFSNGTDEELAILSDATIVEKIAGETNSYRITVTIPQKEWFYTSIANPTGQHAKLLSIVNETSSKELAADNFWTTEYTMQDGFDPMEDKRIHLLDLSEGPGTISYIITFEPAPEVELDVESIETVPEGNDIAETPINELTVTFNKGIDATSFTRDDIVVRYEGIKLDVDIPITAMEGTTEKFKLNTSSLNENGYYILQVNTDNIIDEEGYYGYNGKSVNWMLFKDGLVHYNFGLYPNDEWGSITSGNGNTVDGSSSADYGSDTHTYMAVANENYEFVKWYISTKDQSAFNSSTKKRIPSMVVNNLEGYEEFSSNALLELPTNQDYDLVAVFQPKKYSVKFIYDSEDVTLNQDNSIWEYGTTITIKATPSEGFRIIGFYVNGEKVTELDTFDYTVEGNAEIIPICEEMYQYVLLDENIEYTPEDVEYAHVTLKRSFRKGYWNTICLPCDVDDPVTVFGASTVVAQLSGMSGSVLQFSKVDRMEANVPYIIKAGTIQNSAIDNGDTRSTIYNIAGTSIVSPMVNGTVDTHGDVSFIGTYDVSPIAVNDGNYYLSKNNLFYVDSDASESKTSRFHGYFHTSSALHTKLNFDSEISVGIETAETAPHGDIYNLHGVLVRSAAESLKGMKSGIYIMNGKKFIVK